MDIVDKQFFTKIFQLLRNCFTIINLYLGYNVSRETLYLVFQFYGRYFSKIVSRETKLLINRFRSDEKTIYSIMYWSDGKKEFVFVRKRALTLRPTSKIWSKQPTE